MDKETVRLWEAARILGIGTTCAYRAAGRGEIPTIKIGRLKLVPKAALEEMLKNAGRVSPGEKG